MFVWKELQCHPVCFQTLIIWAYGVNMGIWYSALCSGQWNGSIIWQRRREVIVRRQQVFIVGVVYKLGEGEFEYKQLDVS